MIQMDNELNVLDDAKNLFFIIKKITDNNLNYKYTLNQQIIRAVVSIGSNIAEGQRRSNREFIRFLDFSIGSASEVLFQLDLYPDDDNIKNAIKLTNKIIGQLVNLKKYVIARSQ